METEGGGLQVQGQPQQRMQLILLRSYKSKLQTRKKNLYITYVIKAWYLEYLKDSQDSIAKN